MHRQRIAFTQSGELCVWWTASAHIVLRVNLDKSDRLRRGENVAEMNRLEANAGAGGQIGNSGHLRVPALLVAEMSEARGTGAPPVLRT